jgi:hypothetical protein
MRIYSLAIVNLSISQVNQGTIADGAVPPLWNPKPEARDPKESRNQKSEGRAGGWTFSVFELRISVSGRS